MTACGSFQLTCHVTTMLFVLSEQWQPKRRPKKSITSFTTSPQGWILVHKCQCTIVITTVWTESLWSFLRAILPTTVRSGTWAIADSRKTKGLKTLQPRWVSTQLLYVWVNVQQSQKCSQNLYRPSLRPVGYHYITQQNFLYTRSVTLRI